MTREDFPGSDAVNERTDKVLGNALEREISGIEGLLADHDASIPKLTEVEGELADIGADIAFPDDPGLGELG